MKSFMGSDSGPAQRKYSSCIGYIKIKYKNQTKHL